MRFEGDLFPEQELTDVEAAQLLVCAKTPVFQKYLKILGNNLVRDFLYLDSTKTTGEEFGKTHQFVKGQLALLDTLYHITSLTTDSNED